MKRLADYVAGILFGSFATNGTVFKLQALLVLIMLSITLRTGAQNDAGTFADANNPAGPQDGVKPSSIWKLDPISGAVSIRIPIFSMPNPGLGPNIPYMLEYNSSSTLTLTTFGLPQLICPDCGPNGPTQIIYKWEAPADHPTGLAPAGPWTVNGPAIYGLTSTISNGAPTNTLGCTIYGPNLYLDENGDIRDLNSARVDFFGATSQSYLPCLKVHSTTSSSTYGLHPLRVTNLSSITYPNGTVLSQNSSGLTLVDSNGNSSTSHFTSTYVPNSPPGSSTVTTRAADGSYAVWNITTEAKSFNPPRMPEPTSSDMLPTGGATSVPSGPSDPQSVVVITSIGLPNGTSYTFDYDEIYGTIKQITFPAGGHVRFKWGFRNKGTATSIADNGMSTLVATDVWLSDGINEESHWGYSYNDLTGSVSQGLGSLQTTETGPNGTNGITTTYIGSPYFTAGPFHDQQPLFQETSRAIYGPNGQLFRTITGLGVPEPCSITTTYNDWSPVESQTTTCVRDKYGNITEKDESDFYTGTTPTWIRKTLITYYWTAYPAYESAYIVDKPYTIKVTDGSGNLLSETQFDYDQSTPSPHGNLVSKKECAVVSGGNCTAWYPASSYQYDSNGELTYATDPNNNITGYTYANGYVTQITRPSTNGVAHNTSYQYSQYTGQMQWSKDENNQKTTYAYNDPLFRIKEIVGPPDPNNGNQSHTITYSYDDGAPSPKVSTSELMDTSGQQIEKTLVYDGLARQVQSQTSDPLGTVFVDTSYNNLGQVQSVSNPHRAGESSYGIASYLYDTMGRMTYECLPDNTATDSTACVPGGDYESWTFTNNEVVYQDPNGNRWGRWSDGVGRLTKVLEPNGASKTPTLETDYSYDARGNLTSVNQLGVPGTDSARMRSFTYDGLSRLTCASNPENSSGSCPTTSTGSYVSGTTGYFYDNDGNITSRTDARGITTTYSYDGLNRILSKTYSDGQTPIVCYQYDTSTGGVGRLSNAWTQAAGSTCTSTPTSGSYLSLKAVLGYDVMGRASSAQEQQCVGSKCSAPSPYTLNLGYDLAGHLKSLTNSVGAQGSPLTLTNYFDGVGRLCLTTSSWASGFSPNLFQTNPSSSTPGYVPAGGLKNWYLGSNSGTASSSCSTAPSSDINLQQIYDRRERVINFSSTGQIP